MGISSLKGSLKNGLIKAINLSGISSKYIGTPKSYVLTEQWIKNNKTENVSFKELLPAKQVTLKNTPITLEKNIHSIFADEITHDQFQAFVACIPNARVWGRCGAVITPDDILLSDVSREFGQYKGVTGKGHSIFKQIKLHKVTQIRGRVAVLACAGSYNYHHWLYDTFCRIELLKMSGLYDSINYFVIDYSGNKFQKFSLDTLGITTDKIICCNDNWMFHIQAEELIIPSLPARLGVVSKWAVEFLRKTFLKSEFNFAPQKKYNLYLSRAKAPSRKLINEDKLVKELEKLNFISFFPEDHSISEVAEIFSQAENIIGVHGSGFANLAFCSPGTKVIDILAPKHLDAYYWIISEHTGTNYGYIFGKGDRLPEGTDLVKNKIDDDIEIDFDEFFELLNKL